MRDWGGEFASLGETGSKQTRDLLEKSFGAQEGVILLRKLLHQLFIFVQPVCRVRPGTRRTVGTYFLRSSTLMYSSSICLARSISAASPSRQIDILGRGILGNLFAKFS